jgi:hypothetical protein
MSCRRLTALGLDAEFESSCIDSEDMAALTGAAPQLRALDLYHRGYLVRNAGAGRTEISVLSGGSSRLGLSIVTACVLLILQRSAGCRDLDSCST